MTNLFIGALAGLAIFLAIRASRTVSVSADRGLEVINEFDLDDLPQQRGDVTNDTPLTVDTNLLPLFDRSNFA